MPRGRAVDVDRNQLRLVPFFGQEARQFGGAGGFARTLQADDQDDGRRLICETKPRLVRAEHFRQLVTDDFHDLLAGRECGKHFLAHGFNLDCLQ